MSKRERRQFFLFAGMSLLGIVLLTTPLVTSGASPDAGTGPAVAQDASTPLPTTVAPVAAVPSGGAQVGVAAPPALTDEQAIAAAKALVKKAADAKTLNGAARRMAIMGALASLFTLLLWAVRKWANLFLNDQAVRAFSLLLGGLTFLFSALALDQPLMASIQVGLAGPLAMAVWELIKLGRPSSWLRAAAKAADAKDQAAAPAPQ